MPSNQAIKIQSFFEIVWKFLKWHVHCFSQSCTVLPSRITRLNLCYSRAWYFSTMMCSDKEKALNDDNGSDICCDGNQQLNEIQCRPIFTFFIRSLLFGRNCEKTSLKQFLHQWFLWEKILGSITNFTRMWKIEISIWMRRNHWKTDFAISSSSIWKWGNSMKNEVGKENHQMSIILIFDFLQSFLFRSFSSSNI